MHFSDEDLIAYLLSDADSELVAQIETRLASDEELLERLTHFRQVLGHLDSLGGMYEPPGDLVDSTLARIESDEQVSLSQSALSEGIEKVGSSFQSRVDSLVLTTSLILICCMALPAIVTARFVARKNQCSQNLASTGRSLISYSLSNPSGRIPYVGDDPLTGFAGVYAVHLSDSGYSIDFSQLTCPSLAYSRRALPESRLQTVPSFLELGQFTLRELATLQKYIGGDYAYNVGVREGDERVAPKCQGRSHFAILSDAPTFVSRGEKYLAHDGKGLNLLYEDGRVDFVRLTAQQWPANDIDHPFRNLEGFHAPGLNNSDAVLAPSDFSPNAAPSSHWK